MKDLLFPHISDYVAMHAVSLDVGIPGRTSDSTNHLPFKVVWFVQVTLRATTSGEPVAVCLPPLLL
jgi:hypothetical protein